MYALHWTAQGSIIFITPKYWILYIYSSGLLASLANEAQCLSVCLCVFVCLSVSASNMETNKQRTFSLSNGEVFQIGLDFMLLVLLSAPVERVVVSHIWDFFIQYTANKTQELKHKFESTHHIAKHKNILHTKCRSTLHTTKMREKLACRVKCKVTRSNSFHRICKTSRPDLTTDKITAA